MLVVAVLSICANLLLLERYYSNCGLLDSGEAVKLVHTALNSPEVGSYPSQQGYMLALRHYEQQTQAVRNYLELQCLANSYGMRVVEPFVVKSFLTYPFDSLASRDKPLKFSQLVDVGVWNREVALKYHYSPLAGWEEFLKKAPRRLIVVCITYRSPMNLEVPAPGFDYRKGCSLQCLGGHFKSSVVFLRKHGFRVVRRSCANFAEYAGTATSEEFLHGILGSYPAHNVTVLLSEFRGLLGLYRLPVLSNCAMVHRNMPNITIVPSPTVMNAADKYISTILHNQPYIGILARIEKMILYYNYSASVCARALVAIFEDIHSKYDVSTRFLGMDVGRFGSQGSINRNYQVHGEVILRAVFDSRITFEEWENSFVRTSPWQTGGYIASVQQVVAAKARCLVMVGGGGYQSQAKTLYQTFHPDLSSQCIYKACMRQMKPAT